MFHLKDLNVSKKPRGFFFNDRGKPPLNSGLHLTGNKADSIHEFRQKKCFQETRGQLEEAYDSTTLMQVVHTITTMLKIRDPYTFNHQERVARLAVAIANKMNLSKTRLYLIHMAAIVHDIGKFQIPMEILCKPGKINSIEYNLMKTHCQSGFEILEELEFPETVTQMVLQHHERLNGSGYPLGLLSNEILLESKIIGVADVVEAMASHRPYRPSLGIDQALDEVSHNRGILYDPAVVDVCIKVIQEDGFDFES